VSTFGTVIRRKATKCRMAISLRTDHTKQSLPSVHIVKNSVLPSTLAFDVCWNASQNLKFQGRPKR
jgi:hypothetical protein